MGFLHLKLTIMILFMNISMVVFMPDVVLSDNSLFSLDSNGEYIVDVDLLNNFKSMEDRGKGIIQAGLVILDALAIVFDVFVMLVKVMAASVIVIFSQLEGPIRLIFGIPLIITYGIALMGFLKSG